MSRLREQQRQLSVERTETMRAMRQAGETYEAIGQRFGVSRQRVWELVNDPGGPVDDPFKGLHLRRPVPERLCP